MTRAPSNKNNVETTFFENLISGARSSAGSGESILMNRYQIEWSRPATSHFWVSFMY